MREPKNLMLGTMEPPPLMQLSVNLYPTLFSRWQIFNKNVWEKRSIDDETLHNNFNEKVNRCKEGEFKMPIDGCINR